MVMVGDYVKEEEILEEEDVSQSRHSGPLGPISLQWQKCQLTLLFSRQPDSNRELRKQAPR